jgi:hypothetical protein
MEGSKAVGGLIVGVILAQLALVVGVVAVIVHFVHKLW